MKLGGFALGLKYFAIVGAFAGLLWLTGILIGNQIKTLSKKPPKEARYFASVPDPGKFKFIARNGNIVNVMENVTDYYLDDLGRFMPGSRNSFGFLEKQLGAKWMGFFGEILVLDKWEWPEVSQVEKDVGGKKAVVYETIGRTENISDFFYQMTFSSVIQALELKGNIKANLELSYIVHFLYPQRVISRNKDVVTTFINVVTDAIRPWMAGRDFDEIKAIISSKNSSATKVDGFWEMLENLNGIHFNGDIPLYDDEINLKGLYHLTGIVIKRVNFTAITAVGKAAEAIEAAAINEYTGQAKVVEAEWNYKVSEKNAQSDANAMNIRTEAEKLRIQQTIVDPVNGEAGDKVGEVLTAEKFAASAHLSALVLGDRVVSGEQRKVPKAILSLSAGNQNPQNPTNAAGQSPATDTTVGEPAQPQPQTPPQPAPRAPRLSRPPRNKKNKGQGKQPTT